MSKKVKENSNVVKLVLTIIVGVLLLVLGSTNEQIGRMLNITSDDTNDIAQVEKKQIDETLTIKCGKDVINKIEDTQKLMVYYFDVGQADSILIVNNGKTMLIDAGNNEDGDLVVNNIKKLGIKKLDYVVGTHAHEDHIGGLDNVIKAFEIGKVFMPKVKTNTKTFEEVLDAIDEKNLTIKAPEIGYKFKVGGAECEVMSIGDDESNLNATSIVIRMTYHDKSYLFMGDAEKVNEDARSWPKTDILKVGHHGSSTGSSANFLKQVNPQIAIIQCGTGNKYGHPHDATIKRLEKIGTQIYRNDLKGNILIEQE